MFVGKNPWQSHGFPRARVDAQRDREGPGAGDDRHRPACAPRPPSWPTSTCACGPAPTPGASPRWRRCSSRRTCVDRGVPGRARRPAPSEVLSRARATSPVADYARALRRRRGPDPRGRAPHRPARRASPCSRTSASSRARTRRCARYLDKLLWLLTGNFAKPGGAAPALVDGSRSPRPKLTDEPHAGHRRAGSSAGSCPAT